MRMALYDVVQLSMHMVPLFAEELASWWINDCTGYRKQHKVYEVFRTVALETGPSIREPHIMNPVHAGNSNFSIR